MHRLLLCLLLCLGLGLGAAAPAARASVDDVVQDLPTLPPAPIDWGFGAGQEPPRDSRPVDVQLREIRERFAAGWPTKSGPVNVVGLGAALDLSAPGEPPRGLYWLSDGHLHVVDQRTAQRITGELPVHRLVVRDLAGDGRPEVVAAYQGGSGAFLALRIYTWDGKAVSEAFRHMGAMEPGTFGFYDAEGDGVQELYIDTGVSKGLFEAEPYAHRPFLRDRLTFRWTGSTYRQVGRYRFSTPFYHLNRYLYYAARQEWTLADKHIEPGAVIDRKRAAALNAGPFAGGDDHGFVNGRMFFRKDGKEHYADFGPTGRLLRLGTAP